MSGADGAGAARAVRPAPERMGPADSILWRMQHDPVLRSTVTAVGVLDRPPDPTLLRRRVLEAVASVPRLRQVVADPVLGVGSPRWVVSPDFDVDYHLRRVRVPTPSTLQSVLDFAARETMAGFDRAHPLWELTVVEEVGSGAALVLRFHHALTDGIGGLQLALQILDADRDGLRRRAGGERQARRQSPEPGRSTVVPGRPRLLGSVTGMVREASLQGGGLPQTAAHVVRTGLGVARDPIGRAASLAGALRGGARLVAPTSAPLSPILRGRSTGLRFAAFDVDLARLRAAARAADGTLNDAFVAAVVSGLRRYHEDLGRPADRLRITLPVSTRRPSDPATANRFTPVRLTVPLGPTDPSTLMRVVARLVRPWSEGPGLRLADGLSVALNALPTPLLSSVFGSLLRNVDFVATNVPGVEGPAYVAGAEVQRLYAFAPTSGAAVNVALLTHAGTGCVGVDMDRAAVSDPPLLERGLRHGFDEVLELAERRPQTKVATTTPGAATGANPLHRGPTASEAATMRPTRLHALDAGFLALESSTTPMHFGAIAYLEGKPLRDAQGRVRLGDLRRLVDERLALAPRFRQRPRSAPLGAGRPVWIDDPDYDVADHVNEVVLPSPGTEEQLRELCAHLMMRLLPRSRPLWELWVVDGCADGSVVLIEKVHHVMMDGISGIDVAMLLSDATPEEASLPRSGAGSGSLPLARAPAPSSVGLLAGGLVDDLGLERWLLGAPVRAASGLAGALRDPAGAVRSARSGARRVRTLARGAASLLTPATVAPRTALNRPVGRNRRYAHVEAPLAPLKEVAGAHGCTVNDVVLAAVAGGVRHLRLGRGEDPAGTFQVAVPVSTRGPDEHLALENRLAVYLVPLPVDRGDPVARLEAVGEVSRRRKRQGQAELVSAVLVGADRWPMGAVGTAARLLHHQPFANAVVTNVPGPASARYLLGARVERLAPVVPLAANLDISVGVVSYGDELSFGCFADADRCPDVVTFAAGIADTLMALGERGGRGARGHKRPRPGHPREPGRRPFAGPAADGRVVPEEEVGS